MRHQSIDDFEIVVLECAGCVDLVRRKIKPKKEVKSNRRTKKFCLTTTRVRFDYVN